MINGITILLFPVRFNPYLRAPFHAPRHILHQCGRQRPPDTEGVALNGRIMTLDQAPLGSAPRVTALDPGAALRRLLDLGLVEGAKIEPLYCSPSGGTRAYFLRGAVIALRKDVAGAVQVEL